ncbi:MAG: S1 RNA-binding domain-containing protein, partial [Desulfatirhabdiaceae bacterium]
TCLPLAEKQIREFLEAKNNKDRTVSARVIHQSGREYFTTVILDPAASPREIYWGATFKKNEGDRSGYQINSEYSFDIHPLYGYADENFPSPTAELLDYVDRHKSNQGIFWNSHHHSLHCIKPMRSKTRDALLNHSKIGEHRTAIRKLYLESNQIKLKTSSARKTNPSLERSRSDWDSYKLYEIPAYEINQEVTGIVLGIFPRSVLVGLDKGGIGSIYIDMLSENKIIDPREIVYADQQIEVVVLAISKEENGEDRINLQLKGVEIKDRRSSVPGYKKQPINLDRCIIIPPQKLGRFLHILNKIKNTSCLVHWDKNGTINIKGSSEESLEVAIAMIREQIPEMQIESP